MAELIVQSATVYAAIGGLVAVLFLLFGIDRIDPAARGAYAFRPMIAPGIVLLWPVVLVRWAVLERRRTKGLPS
jgi:hypothetical protein